LPKLGLWIAVLPSFLADPAISTGKLIVLSVGGTPKRADAFALVPRSRNPSVAGRRLLDLTVAQLKA
jgi:DNA-binding transcriptional LysR family regulator